MTAIALAGAAFQSEVLDAKTPVLVDFWAEWCGPCKAMSPWLDNLAGRFEGQVKIVKVNADENPDICAQYNVRSLPALVAFRSGQPVDMRAGLQSESKLAGWLSEIAA